MKDDYLALKILNNIVVEYLNYLNEDILKVIEFYKRKDNQEELEKNIQLINDVGDNLKIYINFIFQKFNTEKIIRLGDIHTNKAPTLLIQTKNKKIIFKTSPYHFLELMNEICRLLNQTNRFEFYILSYEIEEQFLLIEFIKNDSPKNYDTFSYHYGALILLLTLLRGTDFHADNIFCKDSKPIIVDYETLFYPEISLFKKYDVEATGLIKTQNNRHTTQHRYDLNMRLVIKGINTCTNFIQENKNIFNELVIKYYSCPARVIFKPTKYYFKILRNSTHPLLLRDKQKRIQYLLDCLNLKSVIPFIIEDEIQDLMKLSIPYFYFFEGGLYSSRKEKIIQDKITSSLDLVLNNINRIDLLEKEIIKKLSNGR